VGQEPNLYTIMPKPPIPGDYRLWRDFDWDTYLSGRLEETPPEERPALKVQVDVARAFARIWENSTLTPELIAEFEELERKTTKMDFISAFTLMTQIATVYYRANRRAEDRLTFAITAASKALRYLRGGSPRKAKVSLGRFFKEYSD
jgi:hypothetical protein